jgi:hypothetical protein
MKRGIHELSAYEKQEVTDELMLPTGVFGTVLIAGLLCLALVWRPQVLFGHAAGPVASPMASRSPVPFRSSAAPQLSARQPVHGQTTAND